MVLTEINSALIHSFMITAFVFVMMLVVDYLNVITSGRLTHILKAGHWRQYITASFLGATPGCLGAFMNVSFYIHGLLTFGALVGGMIATSGDEAFIMLALFPGKALLLFGLLLAMGIGFGYLTDKIAPLLRIHPCQECDQHKIHSIETCKCFDKQELSRNFFHISHQRAIILLGMVLFLVALTSGLIGPTSWSWKKLTLALLLVAATVIVGSVPDHFLREHIWDHIIKKHLFRIFLWSLAALLFINIGMNHWNLESFVKTHMTWVLLISALAGIIPESGPHMIFVMMFANGIVPFSVLLTSSFVQDGHGMLPLLSYTVKDTLLIKTFNLCFGLIVGGIFYVLGM